VHRARQAALHKGDETGKMSFGKQLKSQGMSSEESRDMRKLCSVGKSCTVPVFAQELVSGCPKVTKI
jgi:hypothetical protein